MSDSIDLPALLAKARYALDETFEGVPFDEIDAENDRRLLVFRHAADPTTIAALVEELMRARTLLEMAASGLERATRYGIRNDVLPMPALEYLERYLAALKEAT